MLVTLSGIVTLVKLVQLSNAYFPMLVTEYPPNFDGMVIAPEVEVDTAGVDNVPPPTDALPFDTV